MTDIVELGIKVDSRDVRKGKDDLRDFERQADKTGKSVEGLEKDLKGASNSSMVLARSAKAAGAAAASITAAAGAAAAAMGALAISNAQAVKEQQAIADAVGVSVTALQQWQVVAGKAGISAEAIGDIFKDTAEKIGEFALTGGGEAKDVFETLSISAERLRGLSPDQQLREIAGALGEVQTRGEKIFILESLANDASRLLPFLENGAARLDELSDAAIASGQALSAVDNQTLLELSTAADEALGSLVGLGNNLSVAVAPAVQSFLETVRETATALNGLTGDLGKAVDDIGRGWRILKTELSDESFLEPQERFNQLIQRRIELQTEIRELSANQSIYGREDRAEQVAALNKELEGVTAEAQKLSDLRKQEIIEDEQLAEQKKQNAAEEKKLDLETETRRQKQIAQAKELAKLQTRAAAITEQALTPQERFNRLVEEYDDLLSRGLITQETYNRSVIDAASSVVEFNDAQREAERNIDGTSEALERQRSEAEALSRQYDQLAASILNAIKTGSLSETLSVSGLGDAAIESGLSSALSSADSGAGITDILSAFSGGVGQSTSAALGAYNAFATGATGSALGLSSTISGAQMASQYGLTTGVAAGGTQLTAAGVAGQSMIAYSPYAAIGSLVGGALGVEGSGNALIDTGLTTAGAAVGGSFGASAGAQLGSFAGPAGAVVGSVLGLALGGLFGGKPSDRTQSVDVNLDTGEITELGMTGEKFSEENRDAADALAQGAALTVAAIERASGETVDGIFRATVGSRDGIRISFSELTDGLISTSEKDRKRIEEAGGIAIRSNSGLAALDQFAEQLAQLDGLDLGIFRQLQDDEEQISMAILRISDQFDFVTEAANRLELQFGATGDAGLIAADVLTEQFGGLQLVQARFADYYANFFTQEEQRAFVLEQAQNALDEFNESIGRTGEAAIDTRKEARAYIESLDLATEAGAEAAASFLELQEVLLTVATAAEQDANNAFGDLQAAIVRERAEALSAFKLQTDQAKASVAGLTDTARILGRAVTGLRFESLEFDRNARARAQASISGALISARSGDFAPAGEIEGALEEVARPSKGLFSSFVDYQRDFFITANNIQELNDLTGEQLSEAERQLLAIEEASAAEVRRLDSLLDAAEAQINSINGVETAVLSLVDALARFDAASLAAGGNSTGTGQAGSSGPSAGSGLSGDEAYIEGLYNNLLGRNSDPAGLEFWIETLESGTLDRDSLRENFIKAAKLNGERVAEFRRGGFHSGGIRLVGEEGPELELTGASRILNAQQTARILSDATGPAAVPSQPVLQSTDSQSAMAISRLESTVAAALAQVAKNTNFLRRWDGDGLPQERDF